jgi:hypothetical protein
LVRRPYYASVRPCQRQIYEVELRRSGRVQRYMEIDHISSRSLSVSGIALPARRALSSTQVMLAFTPLCWPRAARRAACRRTRSPSLPGRCRLGAAGTPAHKPGGRRTPRSRLPAWVKSPPAEALRCSDTPLTGVSSEGPAVDLTSAGEFVPAALAARHSAMLSWVSSDERGVRSDESTAHRASARRFLAGTKS